MEFHSTMFAYEFNDDLIKFVQTNFKRKKIAVHICEEEMDETDYILSDQIAREKILQSIQDVKDGRNLKSFTIEELRDIFDHPEKMDDYFKDDE